MKAFIFSLLLLCYIPAIAQMQMPGMGQQNQSTKSIKTVSGGISFVLKIPAGGLPAGPQDLAVSAHYLKGNPATGLTGTAKLSMPSMSGMKLETPTFAAAAAAGEYVIHVDLPHSGIYWLVLHLKTPNGTKADPSFDIEVGTGSEPMEEMQGMHMKGSLGVWPASREGSGTSWQPDASTMFMKMLPDAGRYSLGMMGDVQAGYVDAGGKRGDKQIFTNSMVMLMARRDMSGGTLGLNFMTSLDPIINGKKGVPDLFQTGETNNGVPLVDRQHPHDLLSEISASYSHPLGKDLNGFIYGGPVGEPALGNVMFMHRASGMEVPEAPISHHWFDSTHISFGVLTGGITLQNKWKLEGSVFNGHEPDENRFDIDPIQLNSASGRLSYNPSAEWSFSASYGYLKSPEALEPGLDQHRATVSAAYSHKFSNGDSFCATGYYGRLIIPGRADSNGWLLEGTLYHGAESAFARFERVDKDELFGVPPGSYTVNKLLVGDVHNVVSSQGFDIGVGAYLGFYSFPGSLKPYYGTNPVTLGAFLRIRPSRM